MRGVLDSLLMGDEGDAQVQIVKLYHAVVFAAAQLGGMLVVSSSACCKYAPTTVCHSLRIAVSKKKMSEFVAVMQALHLACICAEHITWTVSATQQDNAPTLSCMLICHLQCRQKGRMKRIAYLLVLLHRQKSQRQKKLERASNLRQPRAPQSLARQANRTSSRSKLMSSRLQQAALARLCLCGPCLLMSARTSCTLPSGSLAASGPAGQQQPQHIFWAPGHINVAVFNLSSECEIYWFLPLVLIPLWWLCQQVDSTHFGNSSYHY